MKNGFLAHYVGSLGIFCHFEQVFCQNGLLHLTVGLGLHYQVPSRAGIISLSANIDTKSLEYFLLGPQTYFKGP